MAKKNKKTNNRNSQKNNFKKNNFEKPYKYPLFTTRLKRWIAVILMALFAMIISLSFFGKAGKGGEFIFNSLNSLFGRALFFLPFLFVLAAFLLFKPQKKRIFAPVFSGVALFVVGVSGLFHIFSEKGGYLGFISWPFLKFFGEVISIIVFSAFTLIASLILWEFAPKKKKEEILEKDKFEIKNLKQEKEKEKIKEGEQGKRFSFIKTPEFKVKKIEESEKKKEYLSKQIPESSSEPLPSGINGEYKIPPLELFSGAVTKPSTGDTNYASMMIKKTLGDFGIQVEMGEINVGPTVTQYAFKPAEGVKLSKITSLTNDLSLALASHPIRIEAPIPGKSLVGVEVPNKVRANVLLKELVFSPQFEQSSPLVFPLGKDVSGASIFSNLEKMPHMLVAGSTGSGKTIFLQNLIVSMIFRNSPQILRLILVDPKRVEFTVYENVPHLLSPVIFNAQKTINVLNWLIGEMERRFEILSQVKARDIGSFNATISKSQKLKEEYGIMPFIVLIIDELADLMAAKGREVEASIVRLSQLARAVGIHLVVATQRPSVDVITGLIKANLTSRVAFQVASQVDSRTILDTTGAETLLGSGDMLYLSSDFGRPRRIQGCYVFHKDVKKIVEFIKTENSVFEKGNMEEAIEEKLLEELERSSETKSVSGDVDFEDAFFDEAKKIVQEYHKASASLLQRRLKVGYARAARLLDILEDRGIIGPPDGAKPREVYEGGVSSERKTASEKGDDEDSGDSEWQGI